MDQRGVTFVFVADVPADGVTVFRDYEAAVLPLLADYGGRLERRLRSLDGRREVHVLWFPGVDALGAFRADPRRLGSDRLLKSSGARTELFAAEDVVT